MLGETGRGILYIADPMCSWCYGFLPVIQEITATFGDEAPARMVVGGLRPGTTSPMDAKSMLRIRTHWEHVHEATGQPFSFEFFDREGFVYDTEPACRAVVAVRNAKPEAWLSFLAAVHHAFYAENRLVTEMDVLADIAETAGVERDLFEAIFKAPEIIEATRQDFQLAQACGITGFPSVLLRKELELSFLTVGYQPFAALKEPLEAWFST